MPTPATQRQSASRTSMDLCFRWSDPRPMPDGSGVWWAEYAWLGGKRNHAGVLLEAKDGRFVSVTPGVASPPPGCSRLHGLTLPGLSNAHSHAFHRVLRGRTHDRRGSFWSWRRAMYELSDRLDPDLYLRLARAVFAEMTLAGFTTVGEFHYLHHQANGAKYSDANAMGEALIEAAAQAGIRLTLLDVCYLTGGFGRELDAHQRRFSDGDAEAWMERVTRLSPSQMVRVGGAIHSVRAVPLDQAESVASFASEHELVLHAHVSEQPAERDECLDAYGMTPLIALDSIGAVAPRFTAVHGTHLTAHEMDLLAGAGATVCACPSTERDLGDGLGPFQVLRDSRVPLAIGSDSNAIVDPFDEARSLELASRLVSQTRGLFAPDELIRIAARNGMVALGWEPGELAVAALADFATVRLDSIRTAGCDPSLPATAVFAASASDVSEVVIGGETVVHDGHHVAIDPTKEIARCVAELLG
jgi:formiminoglutamate deiminase